MTPRSALRAAESLAFCGTSIALVAFLIGLACGEDPAGLPSAPLDAGETAGPGGPPADGESHRTLTPATLELPYSGNNFSNGTAFSITQQAASGRAGFFWAKSLSNKHHALMGVSSGSGAGVAGFNDETGPAGVFAIQTSTNSADALNVGTVGRGRAGVFRIQNSSNADFALEGNTNGGGAAVFGGNTGTGGAGFFQILSGSNSSPAILALISAGTGPGLQVDHNGSSGHLALFRVNNNNRIRFTRQGKGIFNGGTQTGGADIAEALAVEERTSAYEPGDVLVISTRADHRVTKSRERYSTLIAGVYATKPGVLLTEQDIDESLSHTVPVGMVGVIPTKVSTENGPILRGDVLVTASRPGHAMRATPVVVQGTTLYPTGAILGRAMEEFRGPGTGRIRVLVNVK